MDVGRGISKIRERTCDNGDAVTAVAERVIEHTTFLNSPPRSLGAFGRTWWHVVPERSDAQGGRASDGECQDAPETRLGWPLPWRIDKPHVSAPSHHQRHMLHVVDHVSDRRRHDAGAGVELPEFGPVRCTVGE